MFIGLKKIGQTVFSFAFLSLLIWLLYKLVELFLAQLSSINENVSVAIIAASGTIATSTIAVVASRYYQSKHEREVAHRDKKIELYDAMLIKIFDAILSGKKGDDIEDLSDFLREAQRKLILWSGPKTIKAYAEWHREVRYMPPRAATVIKLIDFFLALREDLGHSNQGINHDHMTRFLLQKSDLFMEQYRKNPHITLDEIAVLEKMLQ